MEKLWKVSNADSNYAVSVEELGQVIHSLGQNSTDTELRDTIQEVEVGLLRTVSFGEFKALKVLPKPGDCKTTSSWHSVCLMRTAVVRSPLWKCVA
jgi:hypothetical protein